MAAEAGEALEHHIGSNLKIHMCLEFNPVHVEKVFRCPLKEVDKCDDSQPGSKQVSNVVVPGKVMNDTVQVWREQLIRGQYGTEERAPLHKPPDL